MHVVQVQIDAGLVQVVDARIAHGRQDAAQVRVAGKEGCLDQGRMGNCIGHLAAFVAGLAAFHPHGDELGGAFAVAHDGLGQFLRHRQHRGLEGLALGTVERSDGRVRGLVGGHDHKRVIGRGVAVDGHAVERAIGQLARQLLHHGRCHTGVCGQKAQHGGHVGADHACALADAGDGHRAAANLRLRREGLGQGVRGHDAFGRAGPVAGLRIGNRSGQARLDAVVGQGFHDHAGGERQDLLGRHAQLACERNAGGARTCQAVRTRACIGVAGVDDHGSDRLAAAQVVAADLHRGRAEAVLGEHARHAGAFVQQEHGQVLAVGLADTGFGHTNPNTGNRVQVGGNRGNKIHRHGTGPFYRREGSGAWRLHSLCIRQ